MKQTLTSLGVKGKTLVDKTCNPLGIVGNAALVPVSCVWSLDRGLRAREGIGKLRDRDRMSLATDLPAMGLRVTGASVSSEAGLHSL